MRAVRRRPAALEVTRGQDEQTEAGRHDGRDRQDPVVDSVPDLSQGVQSGIIERRVPTDREDRKLEGQDEQEPEGEPNRWNRNGEERDGSRSGVRDSLAPPAGEPPEEGPRKCRQKESDCGESNRRRERRLEQVPNIGTRTEGSRDAPVPREDVSEEDQVAVEQRTVKSPLTDHLESGVGTGSDPVAASGGEETRGFSGKHLEENEIQGNDEEDRDRGRHRPANEVPAERGDQAESPPAECLMGRTNRGNCDASSE